MEVQQQSKEDMFLNKATKKLKDNDFKLTKSRIDILTVLAESEKALSPYQIQDILKSQSKKYSAITIYRVLETFMNVDIVHKVHSINAYLKCAADHHHSHRLLVCESCHEVKTIDKEEEDTKRIKGFKVKEIVDEIVGICKKCS